MAHTKIYFLFTVLCAVFISLLSAPLQTAAQEATPDYSGSLLTRSTLTGDWGCARNELAKKGITFKASVTQIYQGNFTDGSPGSLCAREATVTNTGATAASQTMRWI